MKKFLIAAILVAFFASGGFCSPSPRYKSKVPVMSGERYVSADGSRYWVWRFDGRRFINRVDPVTGRMKPYYL